MKDHGGIVDYDFQFEVDELLVDVEPPGPEWLRELIGVDYFADVTYVDLSGAKVNDIGPLRDLTQLKELSLSSSRFRASSHFAA